MTLLSEASFLVTPNGYKEDKLYAAIPTNGNGDMTVTRATTATRVDENDLVSSVASNVPRIDYTGGGCPSILLEPQRTNLFINSNSFVSSNWFKLNLTVTVNQAISPTGENNASLLTATEDNGILAEFNEWTTVQRTVSFFAKKNTSSVVEINNSSSPSNFVFYDLENGVILSEGGTMTGQIEDFGNGWYRIIATYFVTGGTATFGFRIPTAGSVYVYGAQIEEGAYPTSYIPTTIESLTRTADAISKTGISDLIGQTEGVLFIESAALFNDLTQRGISISDGTGNNRLIIYYNSPSNQIFVWGVANGVLFPSGVSYSVTDETEFAKIAVRYRANDITLWVNGYKRGTDITSQALPINFSRFGFDSGTGITNLFAKVKSAQLYKTYLSDDEMAALTTL
jgi:hypothetical protein